MKEGERHIFKLKYSGLKMKINTEPRQAPLQHAGRGDHQGCSDYCHTVSWVWALDFAGSQSSPLAQKHQLDRRLGGGERGPEGTLSL